MWKYIYKLQLNTLTIPIILLVLLIAYLFPGIVQDKYIWGFDTPKIIYPLEQILNTSAKKLELPLWTQYIYFGFPVAAEGQIGAFYLPNIVHIFLSTQKAVVVLLLLHLFIASFGMYLFGRLIKLTRLASVFAAVIFSLSGFVSAHLQHTNMIYAYSYLPFILFFLEKSILNSRTLLVLPGALLGIQFLAGHPNVSAITGIGIFVYILVRYWKKWGVFLIACLTLLFSFIVVASPQLLLLIPHTLLSSRAEGVSFEDATNSSFSLFDFIMFIFPNFFNYQDGSLVFAKTWHFWSYWGQIETTPYVGIAAILLLPIAIYTKRSKTMFAIFVLLTVSIVLALGKNTPIYRLIFEIPFLNGIRAPARFLMLTIFAMAILAAKSFDYIARKKTNLPLPIFAVPLLSFLFILLGTLGTLAYPDLIVELGHTYAQLGFVESLDNPQFFLKNVFVSFTERSTLPLILLSVFFLLFTTVRLFNPLRIVIVGIAILDLISFGYNLNFWKNNTQNTESKIVQIVKENMAGTTYRIYTFSNFWSDLMPNQQIDNRLFEANGFASLPLARFEAWQKIAEESFARGDPTFFQRAGIKYVYHNPGTPQLTEVSNSSPRALATTSVAWSPSGEQTLSLMQKSWEMTAIVENAPLFQPSTKEFTPATISTYEPRYVVIQIETGEPSLLVLNDTFYPGWKAYVQGREEKIYQTNYLFRGVFVPAGKSTVEFKYNPPLLLHSTIIAYSWIFGVSAYWVWREKLK